MPRCGCRHARRCLSHADARLQHDVTGWTVWGSSVVLARFIEARAGLFATQSLLELGAGCGVAGLWAAARASPACVYLSDYNELTVSNLRRNVAANAACCAPCDVAAVDWDDESTWPLEPGCAEGEPRTFPVVIGADLVYRRSYARKLASVLERMVQPGGRFVLATPGQREGLPTLMQMLQRAGWICEEELDAPPEWRANPLRAESKSGADAADGGGAGDETHHFPELAMKSIAYPLNVFVWRKPESAAAEEQAEG